MGEVIKHKILVIDDEEMYTDILPKYIETIFPGEFQFLTSNHPEQALSILKREKIDILVTDLLMPRIDGEFLINMIKKIDINIPIILVTGADEIPHHLEEMTKNGSSIIRKPFSQSEVKEALQIALRRI